MDKRPLGAVCPTRPAVPGEFREKAISTVSHTQPEVQSAITTPDPMAARIENRTKFLRLFSEKLLPTAIDNHSLTWESLTWESRKDEGPVRGDYPRR